MSESPHGDERQRHWRQDASRHERVRVQVGGRVQGVCFRAETRSEAERLDVEGWVRNCADGSVEAEFEGPSESVEALIAWCREGPPLARVTSVDVTDRRPVEPKAKKQRAQGFEIRY